MTCFRALPFQLLSFFSEPHEIVFLVHNVYMKYATVAVSQDFIHTLPTIILFFALIIMFWKNPPPIEITNLQFLIKILQVSTSWLFISTFMWIWLISQQIVYCTMWIYWSQETEFREISIPWWQQVWINYFPPPVKSPVLSSSFLSWIICMIFASIALACAFSTNRIKNNLDVAVKYIFESVNNCFWYSLSTVLNKILIGECEEPHELANENEWNLKLDFPSDVENGDMRSDESLIYPTESLNSRSKKYTKSPEFLKAYETFSTGSSSTYNTSGKDINMNKSERDSVRKFTPIELRHQKSAI